MEPDRHSDEARRWGDRWATHAGDRRCTIWDTYGEAVVQKDLNSRPDTFVLCEWPERKFVPGCLFDAEHCRACRVVLIAMVNADQGLTITVSRELQREMGRRNRAVAVIDILGFYAVKTGDPELVSGLARLAMPAAVA